MAGRKKITDVLGKKVVVHEPLNDRVREVMFLGIGSKIELVLPVYHLEGGRNPNLLVYRDINPRSFSYRGNPDNTPTFMGEFNAANRYQIMTTNREYKGYRVSLERAGFEFPEG